MSRGPPPHSWGDFKATKRKKTKIFCWNFRIFIFNAQEIALANFVAKRPELETPRKSSLHFLHPPWDCIFKTKYSNSNTNALLQQSFLSLSSSMSSTRTIASLMWNFGMCGYNTKSWHFQRKCGLWWITPKISIEPRVATHHLDPSIGFCYKFIGTLLLGLVEKAWRQWLVGWFLIIPQSPTWYPCLPNENIGTIIRPIESVVVEEDSRVDIIFRNSKSHTTCANNRLLTFLQIRHWRTAFGTHIIYHDSRTGNRSFGFINKYYDSSSVCDSYPDLYKTSWRAWEPSSLPWSKPSLSSAPSLGPSSQPSTGVRARRLLCSVFRQLLVLVYPCRLLHFKVQFVAFDPAY